LGERAAYGAVARERKSCQKSGARKLHVKPPQRGGVRMTAEIAIINKSAVALAADSAVTISAGLKEEKIFDSADKLFELCDHNPIGIMIYNGMSFAQTPIQSLIKLFRSEKNCFDTVEMAAEAFLYYLREFGLKSPTHAISENIKIIVRPVVAKIIDSAMKKFEKSLREGTLKVTNANDYSKVLSSIYDDIIQDYLSTLNGLEDAKFLDDPFSIDNDTSEEIKKIVTSASGTWSASQSKSIIRIAELTLQKCVMSDGLTGIVIAGFGKNEIFPTLISYEIDGMISGRLKYIRTNFVDVDRKKDDGSGVVRKATVIPFAQKEMVERFLYGLDEKMQDDVSTFCNTAITSIGVKLLDKIQFATAADKLAIQRVLRDAEAAFVDGLKNDGFAMLRKRSRAQIEDMVEFMPKPELAEMAEALVNLTSIKRRVSRGMETVGGPIDVAIISQSEGFVWVKRKHYFPRELNARFFSRAARSLTQGVEDV
jgi:hypothetical protein